MGARVAEISRFFVFTPAKKELENPCVEGTQKTEKRTPKPKKPNHGLFCFLFCSLPAVPIPFRLPLLLAGLRSPFVLLSSAPGSEVPWLRSLFVRL